MHRHRCFNKQLFLLPAARVVHGRHKTGTLHRPFSSSSILLQQQQQQRQPPFMHYYQQQQHLPNTGEYSRRLNKVHLFMFVPQAEEWIVERFGKFARRAGPGLHFLLPFVERVSYKHVLKEQAFPITGQSAITMDNVRVDISGVLYFRIVDVEKASYQVDRPLDAIINLAQTTMRSEIGRMSLDQIFFERQALNEKILAAMREPCATWGINVQRYEIKDITPPPQVSEAMALQAEAERKKRKKVLESEADMLAAENRAAGKKKATVLMSEADMIELSNVARGEAAAIEARAKATAQAIETIAEAINKPNGEKAVAFRVAQEWIQAFAKLAQSTNTMLLPANASDASSMTAQAIAIYDNIVNKHKNMSDSMTKGQALDVVLKDLGLSNSNQQTEDSAGPSSSSSQGMKKQE